MIMAPLNYKKDFYPEDLSKFIKDVTEPDEELVESCKECFDFLQNYCPIEDIKRSFLLLDTIYFLDYLAFGEEASCFDRYITAKGMFVASYDFRMDNYGVCVSQISQTNDVDAYLIRGEDIIVSSVSPEEAILSIAIHEVRHRLQHKKRVRMFNKATKTRNQDVNRYLLHRKHIFNEDKKRIYKRTRSKVLRSNLNNGIEFDASFVDGYFLAELVKRKSFSVDMLKTFLFLDPIRVFS